MTIRSCAKGSGRFFQINLDLTWWLKRPAARTRCARPGRRSLLSDQTGSDAVAEAASGEEALRAAEHYRPDFILLDINMPGVNGLEIVGQLRKNVPDSKILILTVHNSREYVLHVAR